MIATSIVTLTGLGLASATILAVASRLLKVEEDPRIETVAGVLPGANCGGCGFAGCEAYAAAVIVNKDIPAGLCVVGGTETAAEVGRLSGKAVEAGEPMVSFRRCSRVEGNVQRRYNYIGSSTCASAALLEGGPFMCNWSCLGYGDCMRSCPFDAMYVRGGMVEVMVSRCVSCGICIKACPRSILQLVPRRARVMSHCATKEKMKSVTEVCGVGCINCLKCLKACPAEAITYEKRRIEINHKTCLDYGPACGEACVGACPRGIMRRMGARPAVVAESDEGVPRAGEAPAYSSADPVPPGQFRMAAPTAERIAEAAGAPTEDACAPADPMDGCDKAEPMGKNKQG